MHQLGEDKKAALLKLGSPAVKALASCFGGEHVGDGPMKLRFQMRFDGDCGKGVSYSLILPSSDQDSGAVIVEGTSDITPVIDNDAASLIDLLPPMCVIHP